MVFNDTGRSKDLELMVYLKLSDVVQFDQTRMSIDYGAVIFEGRPFSFGTFPMRTVYFHTLGRSKIHNRP